MYSHAIMRGFLMRNFIKKFNSKKNIKNGGVKC